LGAFLKKNNLEALIPLFKIGATAQGYGLLETVPALYGLMWFTPSLFKTYLPPPVGKNLRGTAFLTMLRHGYSSVWQTIVDKLRLNVVLDFEVTGIERFPDKVLINGKKNNQPIKEKIQFDYVIVTTPLKAAIQILKSPTAEEKDIFQRFQHFTLTTTLYESDKQENTQIIQYYIDLLSPNHPGAVYAQRHSERCISGAKVGSKKDAYVAYQFCDVGVCLTKERLQEIFLKTMEERHVKNVSVRLQVPWAYFHHFNQSDINAGYPWKILEIQGLNRTLFAGSSTCFESVNDVLNYNLMLVNRFVQD